LVPGMKASNAPKNKGQNPQSRVERRVTTTFEKTPQHEVDQAAGSNRPGKRHAVPLRSWKQMRTGANIAQAKVSDACQRGEEERTLNRGEIKDTNGSRKDQLCKH